jgi:hypothetical protein
MPQVDPAHNLIALVIGIGEFSFSPGAVSVADALTKGYLDFGNVVALTPNVESTKEEHFGSYRGVRRKDKTIVTENRLDYQLRCDEWNKKNVEIAFGATEGSVFTQAALSAVAGATLGFTAVPAVIGRWYELRTSAGARLRNLTTVTIATKVEGTDFVLDLLLSRIKFLTAQAADLVPTITCSAITAGQANSGFQFTPLADPVKQGYGRLTIYDQNDNNKVIYDHYEFACEISVETVAEIDGTSINEMTITVSVTGDVPGTYYLRDENENAGV